MDWKRVEPTTITKVDYRKVVTKTFHTPDGQVVTRAIYGSESDRCAAVIALTDDHKVIVARQFRPGPEKVLDEIPGGVVDQDETPEAGARRELREETGYEPGSMELLATYSTRDAYMTGQWFYYLATGCQLAGQQQLDDDEHVEVVLLTISEFLDNAKQGNMTDSFAVLVAYDRLKELEKETT